MIELDPHISSVEPAHVQHRKHLLSLDPARFSNLLPSVAQAMQGLRDKVSAWRQQSDVTESEMVSVMGLLARYEMLTLRLAEARGAYQKIEEMFSTEDCLDREVARNLVIDPDRIWIMASRLSQIDALARHRAGVLKDCYQQTVVAVECEIAEFQKQHGALLAKYGAQIKQPNN